MNFDKEIKKFDQYVKTNYDYDNELIRLKYIHTLNVVKIMIMICNKMNLSYEDTKLAFFLALFHDLGRFREVVRQNTFDNLAFDHGAYSNKVLFNDNFISNFDINDSEYLLIRKAIYFHNKKDLPNNLTNREKLFCELIRDADRIDIFRVLATGYSSERNLRFLARPSFKVINSFLKGESVDLKDINNSSDRVILRFSFISLFASDEAKMVLKELGYFDRYVEQIKVSSDNEEIFIGLMNIINSYMDVKGDVKNVR